MNTVGNMKKPRKKVAIWLGSAAVVAGSLGTVAAIMAPASASTVKAKTENVAHTVKNAKFGTILVDAKGFTLYTYAKDTKNHSKVSGELLSFWPALVVRAGVKPTGTHVSGLGVFTRTNGQHQVTDNGKPLYLFVSDTKAGEVTGQGVSGFSVAKLGSSSTTPTTMPPSGWSGY
jgi:predicted lipoprotein with Yx(FWY)xxD motif